MELKNNTENVEAYSLKVKFVSMTENMFFANSLSPKNGEFHTFMFVESGTATIAVNSKLFSVAENDILLIPSSSSTELLTRDNNFSTHCCNFNAELNGTSLFRHCSPPYHCSLMDVPSIKTHLAKIEKCLESGELTDILKAEAYLICMITDFMESAPIINKYGFTDSAEFTRKIQTYIENRISSRISVEEMALTMGYHPKYFIVLFKKHIGVTPARYIKEARIKKAKFLLANSAMSISDIAKFVGFSTQPKFANDFKREVGCTATEYRMKQREASEESVS